MILNIIPYQNAKNGKIYKKNKKELFKIVLKHKNYKIKFKKFKLHIILLSGYYAGYILDFHKNPLVKKYFTKNECVNISEIKGAYKIHGGFTHREGFDCGHINDIQVGFTKKFKGKTFKTHKFVESELKKFVNSIIKISNKRNKKKTNVIKGGSSGTKYTFKSTKLLPHIEYWNNAVGDYLHNTRTGEKLMIESFTNPSTKKIQNHIRSNANTYVETNRKIARKATTEQIIEEGLFDNDSIYNQIVNQAKKIQRNPLPLEPILKFQPDIIKTIIKNLNLNHELYQLFQTQEFKEYFKYIISTKIRSKIPIFQDLLTWIAQKMTKTLTRDYLLNKAIDFLQEAFNESVNENIQLFFSEEQSTCELYITFKTSSEITESIGFNFIKINSNSSMTNYWKLSFTSLSFISTLFEKTYNCELYNCVKRQLSVDELLMNNLLNKFSEILNQYNKDYKIVLYIKKRNTIVNFPKRADFIVAQNNEFEFRACLLPSSR